MEDFEFVDIRINMGDAESEKKLLDTITRETLENEVKGKEAVGKIREIKPWELKKKG